MSSGRRPSLRDPKKSKITIKIRSRKRIKSKIKIKRKIKSGRIVRPILLLLVLLLLILFLLLILILLFLCFVQTNDPRRNCHFCFPRRRREHRANGLSVGATMDRFLLRPFPTSQTCQNLMAHGEGVLHITDDVLLLARAAVGPVEPSPPLIPGKRFEALCCRRLPVF